MAGRTHLKHCRVYAGGYDLSGYTRDIGPLTTEFETEMSAALADEAMGALPGQVMLSPGTLNGFFDNTASSGLHALHNAGGTKHIVTVAIGDRAAPVAGVPTFSGEFHQNSYLVALGGAAVVPATLEWGGWAVDGETLDYDNPWGHLLHANAAATGANNGTADHDNGGSTSLGGYGILHVLAGDGNATIAIEHSATNTDGEFDSAGAIITFDTVDCSSVFAEIKAAAAVTTTIYQYTRWQVTLDTATTVTFVLSLVRGSGPLD